MTDAEYEDFKKWLRDKDYGYTTRVEKNLRSLAANAKEEKYFKDIEADLKRLEAQLEKSKENDLNDFKDQIVKMLEKEIATRYYFEKGSVESNFDTDKEVIEAVKVLNDSERYNKILG